MIGYILVGASLNSGSLVKTLAECSQQNDEITLCQFISAADKYPLPAVDLQISLKERMTKERQAQVEDVQLVIEEEQGKCCTIQ